MGVFDRIGKKFQDLSRSLTGREHPGAERAVRPAEQVPTWKPEFLIPIDDPKNWGGSLILIRSIVHPAGSVHAFTAVQRESREAGQNLTDLIAPLGGKDIEVTTRVIDDQDLIHAARQIIETESGISRPNTLFLNLGENDMKDPMVQELAEISTGRLGLVILYQYPQAAFGVQQDINLWLRDESPNWRLASLIGIRLQMNWHGSLNIITVAPTREESRRLYQFHEHLGERLSLPSQAEFLVMAGDFRDALARAPRADLNIFGISEGLSFDFMRTISRTTKSSCLFIRDAGQG